MSQNNNYFPNGRTAMLSTKLLSEEKFNRMIDCKSLADAVKILYESNYANGMLLDNVNEFEKLLVKERQTLLDYFVDMSSSSRVTDLFVLPVDYLNAKILMKNKALGRVAYECVLSGVLDADKLSSAISTGKYEELPKYFSDALTQLDKAIEDGTITPTLIDCTLDKAMYGHILLRLKGCANKAIVDYFNAEIDFVNILTAYRCVKANIPSDKTREMLLPYGRYGIDELTEAVAKGANGMTKLLESCSSYKELSEICFDAINHDKSLVGAEMWCVAYKRGLILPYKNDIEQITPLVAYFLSKTAEIDNVRLILVCVKNKVDPILIRERLKDLYV